MITRRSSPNTAFVEMQVGLTCGLDQGGSQTGHGTEATTARAMKATTHCLTTTDWNSWSSVLSTLPQRTSLAGLGRCCANTPRVEQSSQRTVTKAMGADTSMIVASATTWSEPPAKCCGKSWSVRTTTCS